MSSDSAPVMQLDDSVNRLLEEIASAAARHEAEAGVLTRGFISETEVRFAREVDAFVELFLRDTLLAPVLGDALGEVREYVVWTRWVGWNIAQLGPLVFSDPALGAERLALILLAYVPGRLVDDGLDDHTVYKGHRTTLVGALRSLAPGAPHQVACVLSAQVGFSLFHHALRRMRDSGLVDAADEAGRLFDACVAGLLAECFVPGRVSAGVYYHIVRRKQVAYNMILYRLFLAGLEPELRLPLLRSLAVLDEVAQVLNDSHDLEADRATRQFNAFTHGVFDENSAREVVLQRLGDLWETTDSLPPRFRDAVAAMCGSLVAAVRPAHLR